MFTAGASPLTFAVVVYFMWKDLKNENKSTRDAVTKLDYEIHNNGFARKDMLEEIHSSLASNNDELTRRLDNQDEWIRKLAIKLGD